MTDAREPGPAPCVSAPDLSVVSRILHCLEKEAVGSGVFPVLWPHGTSVESLPGGEG